MHAEFTHMLGTEKIKTATYHPISIGIVERFHRHLKSTIKARENDTWSEIVPIILLGIRTAIKEHLQSSCAEIVYGTNLRLPIDMIDVSNIPFCGNNFISNLCNRRQQLNPLATSTHCTDRFYIYPSLQSSSHIFLRIDCVQPTLRQPYSNIKFCPEQTKPPPLTLMVEKLVSLDRVKNLHIFFQKLCVNLHLHQISLVVIHDTHVDEILHPIELPFVLWTPRFTFQQGNVIGGSLSNKALSSSVEQAPTTFPRSEPINWNVYDEQCCLRTSTNSAKESSIG
ncbi:transposon Ty3-G Gag-Pol polyprotein [Trichonephila clavipes]|nr:transposon Ty3-G Gag-Pol polyprotein [Trichonephila clavipes]